MEHMSFKPINDEIVTLYSRVEPNWRGPDSAFQRRIHSWFRNRAGKDFGIEYLAEDMCISKRTLQRRLKGEGVTYRNLRDLARLELAMELISEGNLTNSEMADKLGFADRTCFTAFFQRLTGTSPYKFRRLAKAYSKIRAEDDLHDLPSQAA